ncbi:MAG: ABC transporter ATP-binding protein [Bdellovibrionota bacterium]
MSEVVFENVTKIYNGKTVVVPRINLRLPANQLTVFVGPSGCGKSTLLKLIAGLEDTTEGKITIGGRDVTFAPPAKRGIAMVFQSYALYPHMTVFENMAFALKIAKATKQEIRARVEDVAKILQLTQLLDRKPRQLSGGQRQRVAIGRALVRKPEVFLLDEPLSNLDASLRVEMRIEIAKIRQNLNATMVYVTHDQVEAMTLANNIVVLRAGIVEQMGPPLEIYHKPVNKFVAGFLGSPQMNFIEASVKSVDGNLAHFEGTGFLKPVTVKIQPGTLKAGEKATIGIRPEHLDVVEGHDGDFAFVASVQEQLGDHSLLYGSVGESRCTIKTDAARVLKVGEKFSLRIQSAEVHVFDAAERNVVAFENR